MLSITQQNSRSVAQRTAEGKASFSNDANNASDPNPPSMSEAHDTSVTNNTSGSKAPFIWRKVVPGEPTFHTYFLKHVANRLHEKEKSGLARKVTCEAGAIFRHINTGFGSSSLVNSVK